MKNFKSFGDTTIDFTNRDGSPKKLIIIYGENGSGKTNIASAFAFLNDSIRTMDMRDALNSILENQPRIASEERLMSIFKQHLKDMEQLIKSNKLIDSDGTMVLEYGFNVRGKSGCYILEMNDEQIIHERLEYVIRKRRNIYYDITPDKAYISTSLFESKEAYQEISSCCKKFWGKHSLLSIIVHEAQDKSTEYIRNQISDNFDALIEFFYNLSYKINFPGEEQEGRAIVPPQMLHQYEKGTISINEEKILDHNESMLNHYFLQVSGNIKKLYYQREYKDEHINYELCQKKYIAGKLREIPFKLESKGIKSLLDLVPYMLISLAGSTVVIDEFDSGMHDILTESIILSLYEYIQGQAILTTHATILMRTALAKNMYIISELNNGEKEVKTITYHDPKLNANTNVRNKYLSGEYGGAPLRRTIDFGVLKKDLGL